MKFLKRTLSAVIAVSMLTASWCTVLAQTEEKELFSNNFETTELEDLYIAEGSTGSIDNEFDSSYKTDGINLDCIKLTDENAAYENAALSVNVKADAFPQDDEAYIVMYARYTDMDNNYSIKYYPSLKKAVLAKTVDGAETILRENPVADAVAPAAGEVFEFTFSAKSGSLNARIGEAVIMFYFDADKLSGASFAMGTNKIAACFDNARIVAENKNININFTNGVIYGLKAANTPSDATLLDNNEGIKLNANQDWYIYDLAMVSDPAFFNTELKVTTNVPGTGGGLWIRNKVQSADAYKSYVLYTTNGAAWNVRRNNNWSSIIGDSGSVKQVFWGDRYYTISFITKNNDDGKTEYLKAYAGNNATNVYNPENANRIEVECTDSSVDAEGNSAAILGGGGVKLTGTASNIPVTSVVQYDLDADNSELFTDNFKNLGNWVQAADGTGGLYSEAGSDMNSVYRTTAQQNGVISVSGKKWKNVSAAIDFKLNSLAEGNNYQNEYVGLYVRYADENNYMFIGYSPAGSSNDTIFAKTCSGGKTYYFPVVSVDKISAGTKHKLGIDVKGDTMRYLLDGKTVAHVGIKESDCSGAYNPDAVGTVAVQSKGIAADFDNLIVKGEKDYFYEDFNRANGYTGSLWNITGTGGTLTEDQGAAAYGTATGALSYTINPDPSFSTAFADDRINVTIRPESWSNVNIKTRYKTDKYSYALRFTDANTIGIYYHVMWSLGITKYIKTADISGKLTNGEEATLSFGTQDNEDGSVTLRAWINGELVAECVDNGITDDYNPGESSTKYSVYTAAKENYPRTVEKAGGEKFYVEVTGADTYKYIKKISIEDRSVSDEISSKVVFDTESLVAGQTVNGSAVVKNTTFEGQKVTLVLALYDSNGVLKEIKIKDELLESDEKKTVSDSIKLPDDISGYKLYGFIWNDLVGMKPIGTRSQLP